MRRVLFYGGILFLIIFECLRVYLIMPMPGSQNMNSIDLAYFLGTYKIYIRLFIYLLIVPPFISILKKGSRVEKLLSVLFCLLYIIAFYIFTYVMEADKMFYQPTKISFSTTATTTIPSEKLVIGVTMDGISKAYPIQLIGYHHQVRDTINNKDLMITYCTVCRTGRVYSPIVNGKLEVFRLVGMDHFNALFEDASTKSWWRQSNGECIAGPLKGYKLKEIKSEQLTLAVWKRKYPNTLILIPDEQFSENFKQMDSYDKGKSKGTLTKRDLLSWKDKSWVIGIENGSTAKAYDWNQLVQDRIIQDSFPGLPILILLENDSLSFHSYSRVVQNESLLFSKNNNRIQDLKTGSIWDYEGECIEGKYKGARLNRIDSYQEFLHSWEFFHPKSTRFSN